MERTLHGGCACGRNHYTVEVPRTSDQRARILLDNSRSNRHHQGTPFTAFLRVPLSWYHSSASPFFPDEPLSLIRRTFHEPEPEPAPETSTTAASSTTPSQQQHHHRAAALRRQFCGYCGTPLSSWHERTPQDADFISLTLGSLREDDVRGLEELGLFGEDNEGEGGSESESAADERAALFAPLQVTPTRGAPWFESLVEDSRLGRIKHSRGGYRSKDGSVREEWEVVEWGAGEGEDGGSSESSSSTGKRKIAELGGGDEMDI
ncbi:uncharacterized protein K452DRAFT_231104 [Aplosporella prunicola CBS 121167]|uniref:CENP-V/GFA domain-containing protein n=1 Tax=Aplosporella prunicola CBS 121167 TaxID=1176127 RepID=A0A6A6B9F3_9PEZI|nr:uncharacterized protein K452DRAFT_231104 [Aplosporella prunicola CBS 121167]KAF2140003.1 hypothetical protein K452DRAFT_231104 [Aplosporella prunicola CBS 121167]